MANEVTSGGHPDMDYPEHEKTYEMFIALFGLGAMLRRYGSRFDAEHVFAIILVVVAVALACSLIVVLFERRLVHWTDADA